MNVRVEVTFCDKNMPTEPGFTVTLSLRMSYSEVCGRFLDSEIVLLFKTASIFSDRFWHSTNLIFEK